jgi:cadmium resistance protein CadD (predicted permease)
MAKIFTLNEFADLLEYAITKAAWEDGAEMKSEVNEKMNTVELTKGNLIVVASVDEENVVYTVSVFNERTSKHLWVVMTSTSVKILRKTGVSEDAFTFTEAIKEVVKKVSK